MTFSFVCKMYFNHIHSSIILSCPPTLLIPFPQLLLCSFFFGDPVSFAGVAYGAMCEWLPIRAWADSSITEEMQPQSLYIDSEEGAGPHKPLSLIPKLSSVLLIM